MKFRFDVLLLLLLVVVSSSVSSDDCIVAEVGSSTVKSKSITLQEEGYICPGKVDRTNWISANTVSDTFDIQQNGVEITATRVDGNMWGMNLQFECCKEYVLPYVYKAPVYGIQATGEWKYRGETAANYHKVLMSNEEATSLIQQNYFDPSMTIHCDLDFYIKRDDSSSRSYFKYVNLDTKQIHTQVFRGGYADHISFRLNSKDCKTMTCGQSQHNRGPNCPWQSANVFLLEVKFQPRDGGSAHGNQWHRNQYSMFGTHYYVTRGVQNYVEVGDGMCVSDNQVGGDLETFEPSECREYCINAHYETYFSLWTRTLDNKRFCSCYHDCDSFTTENGKIDAKVYEILSDHVVTILKFNDKELHGKEITMVGKDTEIEELNTQLATANTNLEQKEEQLDQCTTKLATEETERAKCESRYAHVKSGTSDTFTEAEEKYPVPVEEAAVGVNCGHNVGVGQNGMWFQSIFQCTLSMLFGVSVGFYMTYKSNALGDETELLL